MLCILPTKIKKLILVNKRTENKKVSKFWKQFCKPSFGIRTEHNNFFTTSGFPTSNTLIYDRSKYFEYYSIQSGF